MDIGVDAWSICADTPFQGVKVMAKQTWECPDYEEATSRLLPHSC